MTYLLEENNIITKELQKMNKTAKIIIIALMLTTVVAITIMAVVFQSKLSDVNNTIEEITLVEGKDVPSSDNSNSGMITVNLNTWLIIKDLDEVVKSYEKSSELTSSIFKNCDKVSSISEDLYRDKVVSAMKGNLVTLKYTNKVTMDTHTFYVVAVTGKIITASTTAKG
jgi:hypothetical protein